MKAQNMPSLWMYRDHPRHSVATPPDAEIGGIGALAGASSMVVFNGTGKRRGFVDGELNLSLFVACCSSHHDEPDGYRCRTIYSE